MPPNEFVQLQQLLGAWMTRSRPQHSWHGALNLLWREAVGETLARKSRLVSCLNGRAQVVVDDNTAHACLSELAPSIQRRLSDLGIHPSPSLEIVPPAQRVWQPPTRST